VESEHASFLSADVQSALIDAGLRLYHGFCVPGDYLIATLSTGAPRVAELLSIDGAASGGMLSGFVSALVWLLAIVLIVIIWRLIWDIYFTVMAFARRLHEELRRTARNLSTRLGIAFRSFELKKQARLAKANVSEQGDLTALELQVLRSHAKLPPGHLSTARGLARVLRERPAQVEKALQKLKTLSLVDSALGAGDGEDGYKLTQFGAVFLSSHMRAQRSQG
jgi:hypothetical protein